MAERGTVPKSQGEGCASPSLPESCSLQSCLLGLQENARRDFFILSRESLKTPRTPLLPCPGLPASSSFLDAAATTLLMAWTCSPHLQPKRS